VRFQGVTPPKVPGAFSAYGDGGRADRGEMRVVFPGYARAPGIAALTSRTEGGMAGKPVATIDELIVTIRAVCESFSAPILPGSTASKLGS